MTLANKITIARIFLIPLFVLFAIYYGRSVEQGQPEEWQRWAAIVVFLVASVTDCLDGWVARRFGQRSPLGAVLDPIADKGLLFQPLTAGIVWKPVGQSGPESAPTPDTHDWIEIRLDDEEGSRLYCRFRAVASAATVRDGPLNEELFDE